MKQSLKASLPAIEDPLPLKDFITRAEGLKMICCCFEGETPRRSVSQVLEGAPEGCRISILIGPEGDFSPEEVHLAVEHGFVPVHLGPSRLRTETAALTAVMSVYLDFIH
jgi:16S rRNA (uracil1498-N3)-methyltransferase